MVTLTVEFAGAVFGVIVTMVGCGVDVIVTVDGDVVDVEVDVAGATVGEGDGGVFVGGDVKVTTVAVGETGVIVGMEDGVSVAKVGDGMGVAVGVMTIGLPNSLQPKSGAAPMKPVLGTGGIGSPSADTYWATPLSMAGERP